MLGPVELIVAAFNEENQAEEVLGSLKKLDKENVIAILNAAVMKKDSKGKVRVRETEDVDSRRGAIFGAIAGGLVGLLGGPAGVVVGAAAGAAAGGVAANQIDMGFPNETLEELQESLKPGTSAVIALIQHEWVDQVVAELENLGAQLFRQTLKQEIAEQLAEDLEESATQSESDGG
jgi:uncharacterized membrane protein